MPTGVYKRKPFTVEHKRNISQSLMSLKELPKELKEFMLRRYRYANGISPRKLKEPLDPLTEGSIDDDVTKLLNMLDEAKRETAKAYGGCTKCYGKGYATVSGRWHGVDTDQDIGSSGGVVKGGKDFEMKYCTCERGKQLKALSTAEEGQDE